MYMESCALLIMHNSVLLGGLGTHLGAALGAVFQAGLSHLAFFCVFSSENLAGKKTLQLPCIDILKSVGILACEWYGLPNRNKIIIASLPSLQPFHAVCGLPGKWLWFPSSILGQIISNLKIRLPAIIVRGSFLCCCKC